MAIPKSAYTAAMAQSHIDYVKPLVVTDKENKPNNPMHFLAVIIGCPLEKAISYHRGEMALEEVKNVKSK